LFAERVAMGGVASKKLVSQGRTRIQADDGGARRTTTERTED
jgi:hypothetical protein